MSQPSPTDLSCRWLGCTTPDRSFKSLGQLVTHLTQSHLSHVSYIVPVTPVRYTCQWEGCPRFGIEQPSRFALISHCRTHTGEKPYFCPIPECEKHFTRSDALAKHVKGVHDLHSLRDGVSIVNNGIMKGKIALGGVETINGHGNDTDDSSKILSDDQYVDLLDQQARLKTPWWYTSRFVDVLKGTSKTNGATDDYRNLLSQPLDTQQFKIAHDRYKIYLHDREDAIAHADEEEDEEAEDEEDGEEEDDELIHLNRFGSPDEETNGDDNENLTKFENELNDRAKRLKSAYKSQTQERNTNDLSVDELKLEYKNLKVRYATASKINKIVSQNLAQAVKHKRKTWLVNQILLDANVKLGLPRGASEAKEGEVTLDGLDVNMLNEGITKQ